MIAAFQTIALAMIVGGTGGLGLGGGIQAIPPADPIPAVPGSPEPRNDDALRQNVLRMRIYAMREIQRLRREASKPRPEYGEFQEQAEERFRQNSIKMVPFMQQQIRFTDRMLDWLDNDKKGRMPSIFNDPRFVKKRGQ